MIRHGDVFVQIYVGKLLSPVRTTIAQSCTLRHSGAFPHRQRLHTEMFGLAYRQSQSSSLARNGHILASESNDGGVVWGRIRHSKEPRV
jgi:hypothetical protein